MSKLRLMTKQIRYLALISLFIVVLNLRAGQPCESNIPSGTWIGETTLNTGGSTLKTLSISSDSTGVQISDFSAGFFENFNFQEDLSITLTINCDGSVNAVNLFSDNLGIIEITSGQWDEVSQEITLNWSVLSSKIDETTIWRYNP